MTLFSLAGKFLYIVIVMKILLNLLYRRPKAFIFQKKFPNFVNTILLPELDSDTRKFFDTSMGVVDTNAEKHSKWATASFAIQIAFYLFTFAVGCVSFRYVKICSKENSN